MGAKTIAVLTSGGDAPGMNAAVRAVVRSAHSFDMKVFGVMRGYNGLINGDVKEMNMRSVSDIIQHGTDICRPVHRPQPRVQHPRGREKGGGFLPGEGH